MKIIKAYAIITKPGKIMEANSMYSLEIYSSRRKAAQNVKYAKEMLYLDGTPKVKKIEIRIPK